MSTEEGVSLKDIIIALSYPMYYVLLFVPRQIDDDLVCSQKYGAEWDDYVKKVKYRIIPFVY